MNAIPWRESMLLAASAWPWLWPLASGPWPPAQQAIWSLACAGAMVALRAPRCAGFGESLASGWTLAAGLSAAIGLVQYFGFSSAFAPWINVSEVGEAFANLRQRNQFASLCSIGLAAILWGRPAATGHASEAPALDPRLERVRSGVTMVLAALMGAASAASGSRTGMLECMLLVALVWLWRVPADRHQKQVLVSALLAYAVAAVALPALLGLNPAERGIVGRLGSDGSGCGSRWVLWSNVLHLIGQRPWTGWGWGELDHAHFMAVYPGTRFCEILDNAHNLPLHLAVELGVPVAVVACVVVAWWVLAARPWAEQDAQRRMAWAVMAIVFLHSMLEYPLWYGPFQLATGCAWALLLVRRPRQRVLAVAPRRGGGNGGVVVGVCLIAAALYATWDYHRVSQIYLAPERRDAYFQRDTLTKIQDSWLFANQVRFAELVTTELDRGNATQVRALAARMLHFSPEPRVVEKLIESNVLLGDDAQAMVYLARYRTAFPREHADWLARQRLDRLTESPGAAASRP